MKKIAFLKSRLFHKGGLEKYTLRLASAFVKAGCHVTLVTTETGNANFQEGISLVKVANTSKFSLYHLLHFDSACRSWLKKNPQDIVFGLERTTCQSHYRAGSGVHAVFLERRKLVDPWTKTLSCSVNPLHHTLLHLEKKAFESSALKCLFTNSWMVKEEILNHYQTSPNKIAVVHNGVEWNEWAQPFQHSFIEQKRGPFEFLFIGNDYKRKGLSFLLQGAAQLPTRDFKISVVGKDKNVSFFQQEVRRLKLENQVFFYGPQSNTLPFYQSADALVIPSLYDPFANVTVEALAMGLFIVTSIYNGGKEVLTPSSGTVIEELLSPESVASALKISLEHPKQFSSAQMIRSSIEKLDFSHQLNKIVQKTLLSND